MPGPADISIQPIETAGRREAILKALTAFIAKADLHIGDQLPTERELMEGLKVGRSTIREVIRHLQALGVVDIRPGSGTFLRRPVSENTVFLPLSIATQRDGLLQTLEVRRGLEVEAGVLAAQRASSADVATIEARLNAMEAVHLQQGTAGPEDLRFHLSIYEACGNPLFGQLLEQMRVAFDSFFAVPFDRPDFARRSFAYHRMLFNAIRDHDPEAARRHTLAILAIVEEDILEMSHEAQR